MIFSDKNVKAVQIKVENLNKSRIFYNPVMKTLKLKTLLEFDDIVVGYGLSPDDIFEVAQASAASPLSTPIRIAFAAKSKKIVDRFHKAALKFGGTCNGPPGAHPKLGKGHYAAFIIDPNGHNLEAVFVTP